MNRYKSDLLSSRRWAGLLGGLLLVVFASLYFLNVSVESQAIEKPAEELLVVGRLAFTRTAFGPGPDRIIQTSNADGSGIGTLGAQGNHFPTEPAWSPDGTRMLFVGTQSVRDIFVINANGTGQTNLTNTADPIFETNPSWSVTGKIAYERSAQIWTMNEDGTGQAQFAGITQPSPSGPAWSPDGMKLAFSSGGEIWVINANGTNEVRLTMTPSVDTDPAWSPDGSRIAFTKSGSGISAINADGTNETPLTTVSSDRQPAWSPDATKIAYRGVSGLWTMDADGANQIRIITDVINFPLCCDLVYENPAWQPVPQIPNTYVISGRLTDNNGAALIGATINLSGTTNAATTTDSVGNYQFSGLASGGSYTVSPSMLGRYFIPPNRSFNNLDGNRAANFAASRVCIGLVCAQNGKIAFARDGEILTMNPDGTGLANITNNPARDIAPDWGPDGVKILFSTDRDGNYEIYRKNSETDPPVNLTNNPASDTYSRYSPDGASIVFVSNRDGNDEIYKMNADGTNQVRLTNYPGYDALPSFSPDGGKILFIRQGQPLSSLYTMGADGNNPQPIFGPAAFLTSPSYSPDGTKIIMVYGNDVTAQNIYTINSDGTNLVQAGFGRSQPAYSPDGTKVVHNCCFFSGGPNPNGLLATTLSGLSQQRLTSDGFDASPDWQPRPVPRRTAFDFDGDARSDLSYFRPANGGWYLLRSTDGLWVPVWGLAADVLVPADYDGDLKTDLAVWRESDNNFYVLNSFNATVRIENFGLAGDIPTGGDFDGDGKADVAVYRPGSQGTLYYRASMGNPNRNITFVGWGVPGDKPVVGDYDGDNRTDVAVYRPSNGTWYVNQSSNGQLFAINFGLASDTLVPADYDADGKTDLAVFRSGIWYLLRSTLGFTAFQFGLAKDIPAPADYDGDGRADAAVFRNGVWWMMRSQSGSVEAVTFGTGGDKPIPSAFVR